MADKNFDALIERMQTRVYAGAKGKLRLALLQHQLATAGVHLEAGTRVLDGGVGQGNFACELATRGCHVSGIDISAAMLDSARQLAFARDVSLQLSHASIDDFCQQSSETFDLVCSHAVIEWSDQPLDNLRALCGLVAPQGFLSLMFYNKEALVWRNALKGNFYRAYKVDEPGEEGGLTPRHMLELETVESVCQAQGLKTVGRFGVRVIHDYLRPEVAKARSEEDMLEMEKWLGDREPHWRSGRYIHLVVKAN